MFVGFCWFGFWFSLLFVSIFVLFFGFRFQSLGFRLVGLSLGFWNVGYLCFFKKGTG